MKLIGMHPMHCPISGEEGDVTEIYPANFDASSLSPAVFSARRLPDGIHYRRVRSNRSGLVRSDPIADTPLIYELYARSPLDYANDFNVVEQRGVWNMYSITYLFHLLPLLFVLKEIGLHALKASAFGRLPVTLPLGNLYLVARKPTQASR